MLNAKFQYAAWSAAAKFRMNVPEAGGGYVQLPVRVRYFGPANVRAGAKFVVEAFKTPDFTGVPVARAFVADADKGKLSDDSDRTSANAWLMGLPAGRYFVRAYADDVARTVGTRTTTFGVSRKRDAFESWGYACPRERSAETPFTPEGFSVEDLNGWADPVEVYVEDVDTNGNCIPDAYEYVTKGKLGDDSADSTVASTYAIVKALTDNRQNKVVSNAGKAVGADSYVTRAFTSPVVFALASGARNADSANVDASGVVTVESEVESVEISGVSFDADGNVVVEVVGKVDGGEVGGMGVANVVKVPATVTCKVYRKASLSDGWGEPVVVQTIVVGDGATPLSVPGGTSTSGFFKVVVEQ